MPPRFVIPLFLLLSFGCSRMPDRSVPEKKYQIHGVIKRLDAQAQTAMIKHEAIVGWMEAMTMEFPIPDKAEFARLQVGQTIRGTVFVRDFDYHVGDIKIETP